jgi:hypothetical protein
MVAEGDFHWVVESGLEFTPGMEAAILRIGKRVKRAWQFTVRKNGESEA